MTDLGQTELKNIADPVRVYSLQVGVPAQAKSAAPAEPAVPEKLSPQLALPDKPSIAVLAFQNMSGDPEQEYFADGMVEDIITGLSRIKWLFVIARNSSFVYKGKAVDVRQWDVSSACATFSKGRAQGWRLACASPRSFSKPRPGRICGPTVTTARWRTFSIFRIGSRTAWLALSNRACGGSEIERSRRKRPENLDAYDLYLRALPLMTTIPC